MAEIIDIMSSGDIPQVVITGGMQFKQLDAVASGLVLEITDDEGNVGLTNIPLQDTVWTGTYVADVALTTNVESAEVAQVTINEVVDDTNGTYSLSFFVQNTGENDTDITIRVYDDGVYIGSQVVSLSRQTLSQNFTLSGGLNGQIAASSTIGYTFEANKAGVVIAGSVSAIVSKIKKTSLSLVFNNENGAFNSQVGDAFRGALIVETDSNLGTTLSRVEIEGAILAAGLPYPPENIQFFLTDSTRTFLVFYNSIADEYVYERLSVAT